MGEFSSMRVDMRAETQDTLKGKYMTAVTHYGDFVKSMIKQLTEISEKCHYLKLRDAINHFIEFYNSTLSGLVRNAAHEWRESEYSVRSVLRAVGNDDDEALNEGAQFETALYNIASEMFSNNKLEKLTHSVAGINMNASDVNDCVAIVQHFVDEAEELQREAEAEFEQGAEENILYTSVQHLAVDTLTLFSVSFQASRGQFDSLCNAVDQVIPQKKSAIVDDMNNTRGNKGSTIADMFQGISLF